MRRALSLAVFALLTACGPEFDPPSEVDKLRLLAIRADPPEIAAAGAAGLPDRATLASLVADPAQFTDPAREATILHLACTPDPRDPSGVDCTAIETLRDPAKLAELVAAGGTDSSGVGVVGGISLAGVEACDGMGPCRPATVTVGGAPVTLPPPTYVIPAELDLASLPAGYAARINGVQVSVLSMLVAATPDELFAGDPATAGERLGTLLAERENVIAVKRIQVRGPEARDEPNVNPSVPGILDAGAPLPADPAAAASYAPGDEATLSPRPPPIPVGEDGTPLEEAVYQRFTRTDQDGAVRDTMTEEWLYSWYGTAGSFSYDRTRRDESCTWTAPDGSDDEPLPPDGRTLLFVVVRDARGGIDWAVREVRVGD